jgi:hypothetical protein
MKIFDAVEWRKQVINLLPPVVRGGNVVDFVSSLLVGLQTKGDEMDAQEDIWLKTATFNGQKMVLQAALNDLMVLTGIYIEINSSPNENVFLYEAVEILPVYLYDSTEATPVYFFDESEVLANDYDFIIYIPILDHTAEVERRVKNYANLYKTAGTQFKIDTY